MVIWFASQDHKKIRVEWNSKGELMALAPLRQCAEIGCRRLVRAARCPEHRREPSRQFDRNRPSAAKRGYGRRWQAFREQILARNPLCAECLPRGQTRAASVVDHIQPHRGDDELFWAADNHQALCERCHNRKTARGD